MPGEKKQLDKKLAVVSILHCENSPDDIKSLAKTIDKELQPERASKYRRNKVSFDKLIEQVEALEGWGICVISQNVLQFLRKSTKDAVQKFEESLTKKRDGYPLIVCLKLNVKDEEVREFLPNAWLLDMNADLLCNEIYKLWFGNTAYVDENGFHCVCDDCDQQINSVHIIHAGENKQFLHDLSDALEDEINPENSCEFRRFYRPGSKIAELIFNDLEAFVAGDNQDKCMVIISEHLIRALDQSQTHKDKIKTLLFRDYATQIPNFVLLEMTSNNIFSDESFIKIKVKYDEDDLQAIAKKSLSIWCGEPRFKSEPEESEYYSGGTRPDISQASEEDTGKCVPSHANEEQSPMSGLVVNNLTSMEKSFGERQTEQGKAEHQINSQAIETIRHEIFKLDGKPMEQVDVMHIRSENPADLESNPPQDYQPENPNAVKGKFVLNGSNNSLSMNEGIRRAQDISYNKDVRNRDHNNEVADNKMPKPEPRHAGSEALQSSLPSAEALSTGIAFKEESVDYVPSASGKKKDSSEDGMKSVSMKEVETMNECVSLPLNQNQQIINDDSHSGPTSLPSNLNPRTNRQVNMSESREFSKKVFSPDTLAGIQVQCRKDLIDRLDLPIPCVHDWRNLAGHYGVCNSTIHVWSGKMPVVSASTALFDWLQALRPELTVAQFKNDLHTFRRRDAVKILEKYGYE